MKAIVSTFNQAQKGAFSVIVKHQTLRRYVSSSSGNCCCVQVLHILLHLPRSVRAAVPDVPLLLHLAQVHRRHGGDEVEAPGLYYLLTIHSLTTHCMLISTPDLHGSQHRHRDRLPGARHPRHRAGRRLPGTRAPHSCYQNINNIYSIYD